MDDSGDPTGRMSSLRATIDTDQKLSHKTAMRFSVQLGCYKWVTIGLSGVSVLLGLFASVRKVTVNPAVFSALAAVTAGFAGLRPKLTWREKADVYYARRDMLRKLLSKIDYKIAYPPSSQDVADMADAYDLVRDEIGQRLYAINAQESAKWKADKSDKS